NASSIRPRSSPSCSRCGVSGCCSHQEAPRIRSWAAKASLRNTCVANQQAPRLGYEKPYTCTWCHGLVELHASQRPPWHHIGRRGSASPLSIILSIGHPHVPVKGPCSDE